LKERHSLPSVYVVREFCHEIAGKADLRSFTGELWQLA
jgi:hypothetical protein